MRGPASRAAPFRSNTLNRCCNHCTDNSTRGGTADTTVPEAVRGRIDEGVDERAARTLSATCAPHAWRHVLHPRPPSPLVPHPAPSRRPPSRVEPPPLDVMDILGWLEILLSTYNEVTVQTVAPLKHFNLEQVQPMATETGGRYEHALKRYRKGCIVDQEQIEKPQSNREMKSSMDKSCDRSHVRTVTKVYFTAIGSRPAVGSGRESRHWRLPPASVKQPTSQHVTAASEGHKRKWRGNVQMSPLCRLFTSFDITC
ncbi:unnamed protein product [Spodoptera exigua]|nr:unnamed protein product [Spodoptera exigua]